MTEEEIIATLKGAQGNARQGEAPKQGDGCGGCMSLLVVFIVIIGAIWALTGDFNNCLDRDYYRSHHNVCR